MDKLEQLRGQIDEIDAELVRLLERRLDVAEGVARYKLERNLPVLDSGREARVIAAREAMLSDPARRGGVRRLFETLMSISRARQQEIIAEHSPVGPKAGAGKAVFQGVPGAYSQQALRAYFDAATQAAACPTFEDVFRAVAQCEADYGVVPIENSYAGSVLQTYDLLSEYDLHIVGEYRLPIDHALLALPGAAPDGITDVYSHEQALAQCGSYLARHPGWEIHSYHNTAAAAKLVADSGDMTKAAIASAYAGEIYGLAVLERGISGSGENATRFAILGREPYAGKDADKASVCFSLAHTPGALARVLNVFAESGLNMVKIESRPIRHRTFEYRFYVDFEGENMQEALEKADETVGLFVSELRVLGVYPK